MIVVIILTAASTVTSLFIAKHWPRRTTRSDDKIPDTSWLGML